MRRADSRAAVCETATLGVECDGATGATSPVAAWLTLLAGTLGDVTRACVAVADGPGSVYRTVANLGEDGRAFSQDDAPPPDGPWSAAVPFTLGDYGHGLLLVSRAAAAPLTAGEHAWLAQTVHGLATALVCERLERELQAARSMLAQADRLSTLGLLAAGIAHEVRNPLVSIRTFVQLAPDRLDDEEFRGRFRDLALAEIDRICGLLGEVLAFSRPSLAARSAVDTVELIGQSVRLLAAEARQRGVHLETQHADPLPPIDGDEAQLKQVVLNVILNAIQASPPRSTVVTRTAAVDGYIVVEVRDRGSGIPEESVARIFEPFFTTKESGSGLGLFVARRIVADHGGTIEVRPIAEGGTAVRIRLPVGPEGPR